MYVRLHFFEVFLLPIEKKIVILPKSFSFKMYLIHFQMHYIPRKTYYERNRRIIILYYSTT